MTTASGGSGEVPSNLDGLPKRYAVLYHSNMDSRKVCFQIKARQFSHLGRAFIKGWQRKGGNRRIAPCFV